jgi:hypothetical protein
METNKNPTVYQIRIEGHLDQRWLKWFEGLDVSPQPNGDTVISGPLDQSALHGVLNRIRDLGLELIHVQRSNTGASS